MNAIPPGDLLVAEAVIGVISGTGSEAQTIPSRQRLLEGTGLVVPPPGGETVTSPAFARRAARELGELAGGWFEDDMSDVLELRDDLAGRALRQRLAAGGVTVAWDRPAHPYSWVAFTRDGWQAQAVGQFGDFHCIALARALTPDEALGPGGHARPRPAGPVDELLAAAAGRLPLSAMADRTGEQAPNVFDILLSGGGVTVRGGVRLASSAAGGAWRHYYIVRVNAKL